MSDTNNDTTPKKKNISRRDPTRTKEELIKSAELLFNNPGYHFTDSNEIARNAGFAPGTFYQHYKNKTEIFLAVNDRWFQRVDEIVQTGIANNKTAEDLVGFMIQYMLKHFEDWSGLRRSLRGLAATDPEVSRYRLAKLTDVLEKNSLQRIHFGFQPLTKVQGLVLFNTLERNIDALTEGDFKEFGAERPEALLIIRKMFARIIGELPPN